MKKLLVLLVGVVALAGCTQVDEMNRFTDNLEVYSDGWIEGPVEGEYPEYYYCDFKIPQINDFLYENGTVVVYRYETVGGRQIQKTLPLVTPRWNSSNPDDTWNEIIDYEYERGWLRIKYTIDDFNYGDPAMRPGHMVFRVVILW